jgi:hypothetical protein
MAQKQLYSNLQTRPLVREGATKLQIRNCLKEISRRKKIWPQLPDGRLISEQTGRLTVGRKLTACLFRNTFGACREKSYYMHTCTDEGQSKSSRNSLTSTVWCTVSSYRLDKVLLVISTWEFCRVSCAASGSQGQWFLHHDNAPSHTSLVVQQFLASPNHRTLQISLRVTCGCSLLRNWASRGHVSQPWRTPSRMPRPKSGRFQKMPSAGAINSGGIDVASVYVCAQGSYFESDYVIVAVCPTIFILLY